MTMPESLHLMRSIEVFKLASYLPLTDPPLFVILSFSRNDYRVDQSEASVPRS